jgi:hypothetical protein
MALIAFTGSSTERRQLSAVKRVLDQEYEAQVDLNHKPSKGAAQTQNIEQFSDLTQMVVAIT